MPGQEPQHLIADYWLAQREAPHALLLNATEITAHNARLQATVSARSRVDLQKGEMTLPRAQLIESLAKLKQAAEAGKRVMDDEKVPSVALLTHLRKAIDDLQEVSELRGVLHSTPLRCYPTVSPVLEAPHEWAFDLGQCTQLHYGEVVRVLGRPAKSENGTLWYVRGAYSAGWIASDALSAPLPPESAKALHAPKSFVVVKHDRVAIWTRSEGGALLGVARMGTRFPLLEKRANGTLEVQAVGAKGITTAYLRRPSRVSLGYLPLTHANLLRNAFVLLHSPYGWGGMGAQRDCSRLMMDIFSPFGLELPRNSRQQAQAGLRHVDVSTLSDAEKRRTIAEVGRKAVTLLYFKGHIMLYLGREADRLYALHLFSGYLVPCPHGGETMHRVNHTSVTHLELGRGSSRRAFIERIERLVIIGPAKGKDPSH
ncbi:MAG: C40 family peptidase [Deltaproteobacteria bacterium]|nr:C40 family peptidase [Deltaproteobacteria bacterium]